jgi:hypothetical protein
MKEIRGDAKNIRALLGASKYAVDYYQREYRWQTKQVAVGAKQRGAKQRGRESFLDPAGVRAERMCA